MRSSSSASQLKHRRARATDAVASSKDRAANSARALAARAAPSSAANCRAQACGFAYLEID